MKKNLWEVILRIVIAAATAALTALGTTSCMGHGPIWFYTPLNYLTESKRVTLILWLFIYFAIVFL